MSTKHHLLLVALLALSLHATFAADSTPGFPKMGGVGVVATESGEGSLGACSVGVKLSARGLQLRETPALGELAMPSYPAPLFAAGIVGEAQVAFELAKDGSITNAKVIRAANPEFGESALASVSRWKFQPLKWRTDPKSVRVTATFVFSIFYE